MKKMKFREFEKEAANEQYYQRNDDQRETDIREK